MKKGIHPGALVLVVCLAPWAGRAQAQPPSPAPVTQASLQSSAYDAEAQRLLDQLSQLGSQLSSTQDAAQIAFYNMQQAQVLALLVNRSHGDDQAAWVKQMADCLNGAAMNNSQDRTALSWLERLAGEISAMRPGSPLAAYVTYRHMQADYTSQLNQAGDQVNPVQEQWRDRLEKFVQQYPLEEDTPSALMELATVCEFLNREPEARAWYQQLVANFPNDALAGKARGVLRRLDLEGQTLFLTLPLLSGEDDRRDEPFDVDELRGKVVVVYFWSSAEPQCAKDFEDLRQVASRHGRDVALLCVSVDRSRAEARAFVQAHGAPGVQVWQRGGLEGRATSRYGVLTLPSVVLVGKDGNVAKKSVEVFNLEEEIAKLLQ